jgi:hypothetical protein
MSRTDKSTILRTFNTNFFQFLDELIHLFPEKREIQTAKVGFETIKKSNPTLLAKLWYSHIYCKYKDAIDSNNIDFFLEKDYQTEILNINSNTEEILNFIENIRDPLRNLNAENKNQSMKYIKLLSQLSVMYNGEM